MKRKIEQVDIWTFEFSDEEIWEILDELKMILSSNAFKDKYFFKLREFKDLIKEGN